jgi:hypothetical protein
MDVSAERKIFASFTGNTGTAPLSALCRDLFEQQKASWDMLASGHAALGSVRVKELLCNGYSVRLHHNPVRIKSTVAPVDRTSINNRPCFLCLENLPDKQRGILYRQDFIVLCNPFPITQYHYTIPHSKHILQSFHGHAAAFLTMAKDFHPGFNVFYNGPESGASAPDHLHFQAAPSGILPVEQDMQDAAKRVFIKCIHDVSIFKVKNVGRGVIIIEGSDGEAVRAVLTSIISAMKGILRAPDEPKMNLLASYSGTIWRIVIFPRQKHRPDVFYLPGDDRILISPGLVEMGGIVITPKDKDFNIVDHDLIQAIYKEVSIDAEIIQKILDAVSS